ncbi:ABC transporter permease [Clostridium sp. ZS2-4]|uniref:ABC transporter permease n=1 Tax=Clostridium sp. ZS2-4 TaxID=2987703 RepID=UPI00227AFDE1|nr:ABC transporter permease [Clostridium sp. ZS2-4]MCY6355912.1 ABC transporter permease [Clostridium sp. ZS2-4]
MKELFISEWERLWSKKITWFCFFSIPLILMGTLKYYLKKNITIPHTSPEYTTFLNFPSVAMQEQLITVINILALLFIVLSVTEEYRSGQLRMVMIRTYSFTKIVVAKYLVVLSTLLLFLICYFAASVAFGYMFLPKTQTVMFFFIKHPFMLKAALMYNIKYYMIAFLTLAAISAFYMFISMISKTTTIAVALNVGFLIFSAMYGYIIQIFSKILISVMSVEAIRKSMFLSLIEIQYQGICILLSGKFYLTFWILSVLGGYIALFSTLLYFLSRRKDNLI